MGKYKFDKAFELFFIKTCNESKSMSQAAIKLGMNYKTLCYHAKILNCFKPNQAGRNIAKVSKEIISLEDIFSGKCHYQSYKLKKRLLKEKVKIHQCECCKLTEWLNRLIPLELHHIDGNPKNNALENLSLLCPNCHALTENYRAKNINNLSASLETMGVESLKFGEAFSEN